MQPGEQPMITTQTVYSTEVKERIYRDTVKLTIFTDSINFQIFFFLLIYLPKLFLLGQRKNDSTVNNIDNKHRKITVKEKNNYF